MRTALLTLLCWLACSGVAAAQEPVCRGQLAPPTAEQLEAANLQYWIDQRKSMGFRHDAAYVRELAKEGLFEYDVGDFPVTRRENEYLKLRDRLTLGAKGNRYLREHRDVDGGVSVEDDWPREPYLLVRFTRDVRRHLAALKRVAATPDNLRAKRVRYSERSLARLQDRVSDDWKRLDRAGYHMQGVSSDTDSGKVEVELVTKHSNAQAYFSKRYGPRVKVIVTGADETTLECAKAVQYEIAPDGLSLKVVYESGGGAKFERADVAETADGISIGIVERVSTGFRTADLVITSTTVPLVAPLAARPVIDAATGKRLIQVGPFPGDPPCPVAPELTPLEEAVAQRADQGLNADPAYTQRLLDRNQLVTAAEQRWLDRKYRLHDSDPRVDRYLRRHRDAFGGVSIEGTYPEAPYLLYRFTRDRARHERAIERLTRFKGRVRTRTVQFTVEALGEVEERISADVRAADGFLDGYGRAGFYVRHVGAGDQVVSVNVFTARPDAAAWFGARYGPAVRVEVEGDRFECASQPFGER